MKKSETDRTSGFTPVAESAVSIPAGGFRMLDKYLPTAELLDEFLRRTSSEQIDLIGLPSGDHRHYCALLVTGDDAPLKLPPGSVMVLNCGSFDREPVSVLLALKNGGYRLRHRPPDGETDEVNWTLPVVCVIVRPHRRKAEQPASTP